MSDLILSFKNLLKWSIISIVIGLFIGGISSLFASALKYVTNFRTNHHWILYFLPLLGILIVFLYQKYGQEDGGTTQVLSTIKEKDDVSLKSAPLIFISTILTHLGGASAGREGAAIQLGGSLASEIGKWLHLDEEDLHTVIMCGMSAAFSAVFGTPMAASIFSLEVTSVGVMYYSALLPCIFSSIIASNFAASFGINPEAFAVQNIPMLSINNAINITIISIICALVSICFCLLLKYVNKTFNKLFNNPYLKIIFASILYILITTFLQTDIYMGAGNNLIEEAIVNQKSNIWDFILKMFMTAIIMRSGFRGGEIVPSFAIGATLGCSLGNLINFSPSISAACGMIALFCSVTNCPITSILIAFELFGFDGVSYYLIAVAISYALSGYYGLYKDQTIVYSKYKAKFTNQNTKV